MAEDCCMRLSLSLCTVSTIPLRHRGDNYMRSAASAKAAPVYRRQRHQRFTNLDCHHGARRSVLRQMDCAKRSRAKLLKKAKVFFLDLQRGIAHSIRKRRRLGGRHHGAATDQRSATRHSGK